MKKLVLLLLLVGAVACGPSWKNIVIHPDGTYEDVESGECWRDSPNGLVPAPCPPKKKG